MPMSASVPRSSTMTSRISSSAPTWNPYETPEKVSQKRMSESSWPGETCHWTSARSKRSPTALASTCEGSTHLTITPIFGFAVWTRYLPWISEHGFGRMFMIIDLSALGWDDAYDALYSGRFDQ